MATYTRTWYGRKIWWARFDGSRTGPYPTRAEAEKFERDAWDAMMQRVRASEQSRIWLLRAANAQRAERFAPVRAAWRLAAPPSR